MTDSATRPPLVIYPETDGLPMSESDQTRDYLLYAVATLEAFFKGRPNVYVSGNSFIYYEEDNPNVSISPDVFVIFGVSKRKRRSYQVWRERGKIPSFVLEITSRSTKKKDEIEKPQIYAQLGIDEYFQYDPTGDYLTPQLKGRRLVEGHYQPLSLETRADISYIHSGTLGLDLCLQNPDWFGLMASPESGTRALRFFDPQTQTWLLSYDELEKSRLQTEEEKTQLEQEKLQAEQEKVQAEQRALQAEQERDRSQQALRQAADRLAAIGLDRAAIAEALGIDPETLDLDTRD